MRTHSSPKESASPAARPFFSRSFDSAPGANPFFVPGPAVATPILQPKAEAEPKEQEEKFQRKESAEADRDFPAGAAEDSGARAVQGGQTAGNGGVVQMKCACGGAAGVSGMCEECRDKERLGLQPKLAVSEPGDSYEQEADRIADRVSALPEHPVGGDAPLQIQRVTTGQRAGPGQVAPASVEQTLAIPGRPMEPALRRDMEQHLGHDFSAVRVHSDAAAEQSARDVKADAYTVGSDLVFAAGKFAPGTHQGRRLIAHELTHVVQQGGGGPRRIFRQACPHDAPKSSKCGVFKTTGEELLQVGNDRIIAEAMKKQFGGDWIGQVYSPPNLYKGGQKFGGIDAMKVTAGQNLTLDVAEIKSRNTTKEAGETVGGCLEATSEAKGYVDALAPIAPRMAGISKGLEKMGGLRIPECRDPRKDPKAKLVTAGVKLDDSRDMFAWCVLNSIQNKLERTFTKGFDSVLVKLAGDGTAGDDYTALVIPIPCGKGKQGYYRMLFQVNQKGGVSYRCERRCQPTDEERKQLEKDVTKELEIPIGKDRRKFYLDPAIEEDPHENVEIVTDPDQPGVVDLTDVAIITTAGIAAITALHLAAQKAKSKAERELAIKAAERLAKEIERRGAAEVGKMLDSKRLLKLGTEAYEKEALKKAEELAAKRLLEAGEKRVAGKLAKKVGEKAGKAGAKALLKGGAKAIPYVNVAIIAYELLSAGDAMAKGAELEFGISGSEADLSGATKIDIKGDKPESQPTSDVKATDTQIDVELGKAPNMEGLAEIETRKVTMKGKAPTVDGAKVTVNLSVKMENTTITFKNAGILKGGHIVLSGAFDIKDSEIEIDLPPGTEAEAPADEVKREIKGVKVKVTKLGTGTGAGEAGGKGGKPTQGGKQEGEKPPEDPEAAERTKLVGEIQADPQLKQLYDRIFTKKGVPKVEVLRRLAALKARLKAHPELLEKLLGKLTKAEVTDPIKELIEPMELELDAAEKKTEAKPAEEIKPGTPTTTAPPTTPPTKKEDKPPETGTPKAEPTEKEKASAAGIEFWAVVKDASFKRWRKDPAEKTSPAPTTLGKMPVNLTLGKGKDERTYNFWAHGTLIKQHAAPKPGFQWSGDYDFAAPSGIFKSTKDDKPIYFTDAGKTKSMVWGLLVKPEPVKGKK